MLFLLAYGVASAVPAYPWPFTVKQADGTTLKVLLKGDEFSHQYYTTDGIPVVLNAMTRNYEYATTVSGSIIPTGITASDPGKRSKSDISLISEIDFGSVDNCVALRGKQVRSMMTKENALQGPNRAPASDIIDSKISKFPTTGKIKTLVLLVEFDGLPFQEQNAAEQWNKRLNGRQFTESNATGSVWDFYNEGSSGKFDPEFVIAGPITLSKPYTYYGENGSDGNAIYRRLGEMIAEACQEAAKTVDFSQFDYDDDGLVDNVYIIYSGYGEADSHDANTIWPHSWEYLTLAAYNPGVPSLVFDGKTVNRYTMSQELNGTDGSIVGIGTFTHEFGHVLGLADHYATDYSSLGTGLWDYMSTGCYLNNQHTPPAPSAFERVQMGWMDFTELKPDTEGDIPLPMLTSENFAYQVSLPDNTKESFILENRQNTRWDAYLPGNGMLVWHLDLDKNLWLSNQLNNKPKHQHLDVVEADREVDSSGGNSGDTFPGSAGVTKFNFKTWDGHIGFALDDIDESDPAELIVRLNSSKFRITDPEEIMAGIVRGHSVDLSWTPVENVDYYTLTAKSKDGTLNYSNIKTSNFSVTGLNPETTYDFTLRACVNYLLSKPLNITITTTAEQFGDKSITALDASDVSDTSITANWEPVADAEGYLVNLYYRNSNGNDYEKDFYGFTDKKAGLPIGWTTNSIRYNNENFNLAAPSLNFFKDEHNLQILANGEAFINSLNLWWKGTQINDFMEIWLLDGEGEWTKFATARCDTKGHNDEFEFPDSYGVKIQFLKNTGKGELYIDDVEITHRSMADSPVEGMQSINAGNTTSYTFKNLESDRLYSYKVCAFKGTSQTIYSQPIEVRTLTDGSSAIDSIIADEEQSDTPAVIYDLQGRQVKSIESAPRGIYIMRRGANANKIIK